MSAGEEESGEVKHKAIWDEVSTDRVVGFKLTASSNSKDAKDSGYIFPPILLIKSPWMGRQWVNLKRIQTISQSDNKW